LREVIRKNQKIENSFFSFSTSTGDIAIIVYEQIKDEIVSGFQEKPKKVKSGLTAVSILFDEALVNESNVGLSLLHKISLRNVVLDAATTTYNEFTLVFESIYLHDVVEVLNPSKVSSPHRFIRM
jgi:hypothetical protein